MALSPARSPDFDAAEVPGVTDGSTGRMQSKNEEPSVSGEEPGTRPCALRPCRDGTWTRGVCKHKRQQGGGFSPFHTNPVQAGSAGHLRDKPLRPKVAERKGTFCSECGSQVCTATECSPRATEQEKPRAAHGALPASVRDSHVSLTQICRTLWGAWVRLGLSGHWPASLRAGLTPCVRPCAGFKEHAGQKFVGPGTTTSGTRGHGARRCALFLRAAHGPGCARPPRPLQLMRAQSQAEPSTSGHPTYETG